MTPEEKELTKQAIDSLKFKDLRLFGSNFAQYDPITESKDEEVIQQNKQGIAYQTGTQETDDEVIKIAQVLVSLGIRVIPDSQDGEEEPTPFFIIEADFAVEYEITKEISDEALKAFADYNAVHNVWPFWRQHVFDIVQRAKLPEIRIPFYSI